MDNYNNNSAVMIPAFNDELDELSVIVQNPKNDLENLSQLRGDHSREIL